MISCGARLAVFDIAELREVTSYDELELDTLGDRKTALFLIMSDTDDSFNFLRQSPQVLGLQFVDSLGRANRDNAIDVYMGDEYMDVLADGTWEGIFKVKPPVFTREEKRAWLDQMQDVTLGSDAFFPFSDNIERAHKSGVKYIAQPGGSVRDSDVIACCDKYDMVMAFTGIRLFHH